MTQTQKNYMLFIEQLTFTQVKSYSRRDLMKEVRVI